jgi:hypothetical protein
MVGLVQVQWQPGSEGFLGRERVGWWRRIRDTHEFLGVCVWWWYLNFGHFEGILREWWKRRARSNGI